MWGAVDDYSCLVILKLRVNRGYLAVLATFAHMEVMMQFKRFLPIILIASFIATPAQANFKESIKDFFAAPDKATATTDKSYERAGWRETSERLVLSMLQNGISFKNGKLDLQLQNAAVKTRDVFFKVAGYKMLQDAIKDASGIDKDIYKKHAAHWVEDGLDLVFRGIKYAGGDQEDKSVQKYMAKDFAPYIIRKIIVRLVHNKLIGYTNLNAPKNIASAYQTARGIPLVGIQVDDASKKAVEYAYDSTLEYGLKIFVKHIKPKIWAAGHAKQA